LNAPPAPTKIIQGRVLLYKAFVGIGHPPKDKYIYILGSTSDGYTHFFLTSTQDYSKTSLARETVFVPVETCSGLPEACWIQCFHRVENRRTLDLQSGLHFGTIIDKGVLPEPIQKKVREVVKNSFVLEQREIDEVLAVLSVL
jgi:hypothetical protein